MTELVTVSTDWVQTNFNKAVIGQVQRTAYEKLEELESTGQNLSAKNRRGFVSVENCGVQISEIDKRVINRLKYNQGGTIRGRVFQNRWFGYCNEAKVSIELSKEWVEASFDKFYLMQVRSSSGESSFLKIPPGDDQNSSVMVSGEGPKINYRQKEDERTCMVYSLACAMHANGYHDLGSWIHNRKKRYMNALNAFDVFVSNIRHEKKNR